MAEDLEGYWLPRMLFVVTSLLAVVLGLTWLVTPWLTDYSEDWPLIQLLGRDLTVRRTLLAVSIGLFVTAFVFFRPQTEAKPRRSRKSDV